jgi:adenylate cyclase
MKRKIRHFVICGLFVIASAAAPTLLNGIRFFQILNFKALDTHFVVRGKIPTSDIFLVMADQKALDTYPELRMFWHKYYAEAIRAAADGGAKAIGLDAAFAIPVDKWEKGLDQALAETVASSPVPVVCASVDIFNSNPASQQVPINILAAGLGLAAFANLTTDADDFIRRQELIAEPSSNPNDPPPIRSLAMLLAEKYYGTEATFKNGNLVLNGSRIPIGKERDIAINYAGPHGTFPRASLVDFLDAAHKGNKRQIEEWVKGKAVIVGVDFVNDSYNTPFFTFLGGASQWTMPGTEIHANTLHTLLKKAYLLPVPEVLRTGSFVAAAAVTATIVTELSPGLAAAGMLLELFLILVGTHWLFRQGRILSTSEMLVAVALCLILSLVYRFATAENRGNLFKRAVAVFVGKDLAASLDRTEGFALSGKTLNLTILFTDIRGFTAFSEKICEEEGPKVLVKLLNDYMSLMVSIIVKHHGQVNKFIGDGILAIFSDDDEGAVPGDHALRCVRCANEMVTAPSRFSTGSGIHSGPAVVGNIGSADKMEYTVLGDTVNLASRLESLNKEHHTKLLMTEATQELLNGQVATTHLAAVPVRGKAAPINLYTVTSLVPAPEPVAAVSA